MRGDLQIIFIEISSKHIVLIFFIFGASSMFSTLKKTISNDSLQQPTRR